MKCTLFRYPPLAPCLLVTLLVGCSGPDKSAQGIMNIEEQIQKYTPILALDSTNAGAHRALGNAYLAKSIARKHYYRPTYRDGAIPLPVTAAPGPLVLQQDIRKAIYHLGMACRLDSLSDIAWSDLGRAHLVAGKSSLSEYSLAQADPREMDRARKSIERSLMLNPHSSQAQYLLGACFNTRSFLYDPEKATACLEKAVGLDPDLADAWYELTKIARELREYGRAARYFHRALKAGLSDPEAYIESYRHFSRFRETTDYPRMNRNLPFVARAWAYAFERGARVFMKTRAESRSEMTSIVLELDSIPPVLMSEVAIELWRQGHTASAIDFYVKSAINSHGFPRQFYEQVQSAHPTFVNAYIDLAALMYSYPRGGAYAVALLRKAIDIEPTREDLYLKVSSLYRQIGSLDSAAMYLERCLAMSNSGMTSWGAFRQLGWIYARNRSFVKYYNLYSRAKGSQKDAVLDGILDYSYRGDQIDSSIIRRLYENLISGDNESNSKVYSYLALHYGMRGAFLSELRYRERAFQSDPSNVEAGRALVRAYQQGGKYDRAIGVCESMMGMSPRDVETLFSMAALLGKTGRSTDASRCYDRINELNPDEAEKCFWKAVELTPLRSPTQVLFLPNVITTLSFDRQGRRIDPADISDLLYQRAARLGHIAAQDTLRRRNVSW